MAKRLPAQSRSKSDISLTLVLCNVAWGHDTQRQLWRALPIWYRASDGAHKLRSPLAERRDPVVHRSAWAGQSNSIVRLLLALQLRAQHSAPPCELPHVY